MTAVLSTAEVADGAGATPLRVSGRLKFEPTSKRRGDGKKGITIETLGGPKTPYPLQIDTLNVEAVTSDTGHISAVEIGIDS